MKLNEVYTRATIGPPIQLILYFNYGESRERGTAHNKGSVLLIVNLGWKRQLSDILMLAPSELYQNLSDVTKTFI